MTRSSPGTVRIAADAARSAGCANPCALISGNVTASSIGTLGASSAVGAPFLLGDPSMRRAANHQARRARPPDPAPAGEGGPRAGDEGGGADVPAVPREHGGQDGDP